MNIGFDGTNDGQDDRATPGEQLESVTDEIEMDGLGMSEGGGFGFGSETADETAPDLLRSEANGRFVPGDAPRVPTGRRNPNNGHYTGPTDDVEFGDLQPDRVDEDLWETDRPAAALRNLREGFGGAEADGTGRGESQDAVRETLDDLDQTEGGRY